jgi:hypothetical protein
VTIVAPSTSLVKLVERACASPESESLLEMVGVNEMTERSPAAMAPTMMGITATTMMSSMSVKPLSSPRCARSGASRLRVTRRTRAIR